VIGICYWLLGVAIAVLKYVYRKYWGTGGSLREGWEEEFWKNYRDDYGQLPRQTQRV
jgi:hypothetical protein